MLHAVGRGLLRRIFPKNRANNQLPSGHGHASQVLAERLSKVEGSSFIWCTCNSLHMTPIVHENGGALEIIALSCTDCGNTIHLNVGVITGGE